MDDLPSAALADVLAMTTPVAILSLSGQKPPLVEIVVFGVAGTVGPVAVGPISQLD